MAFSKSEGKIDGEITENHAILIDHFEFDAVYSYVRAGSYDDADRVLTFNPLTAGATYIRVFIFY